MHTFNIPRSPVRLLSLVAAGMLALAAPRAGAQVVWDGYVSSAWGTAGNWIPVGVPAPSADVAFNASGATGHYDITLGANRTARSLTFRYASGVHAFTFSGYTLTVNTGGIVNNDSATQIFNSAVSVGSAQTWNAAAGGLTFGSITLGNDLTLSGPADIRVQGLLTNSGGSRTITNNGT